MHIISSGYPWGIFLCRLTFVFLMNVFHFRYLKNNKTKYMIVQLSKYIIRKNLPIPSTNVWHIVGA